jgi:hypothetical protein
MKKFIVDFYVEHYRLCRIFIFLFFTVFLTEIADLLDPNIAMQTHRFYFALFNPFLSWLDNLLGMIDNNVFLFTLVAYAFSYVVFYKMKKMYKKIYPGV